jgi:hypothetical protein
MQTDSNLDVVELVRGVFDFTALCRKKKGLMHLIRAVIAQSV